MPDGHKDEVERMLATAFVDRGAESGREQFAVKVLWSAGEPLPSRRVRPENSAVGAHQFFY